MTSDPFPVAPLPPPVDVALVETPPSPCPYLPNRESVSRALMVRRLDPDIYHEFMDRGFRRAGQIIYQPACPTCRACQMIRVDCANFAPDKSQRRIWRKNADLATRLATPRLTDEKFDLYSRYLLGQHRREEPDSRDDLERFLYESPVETIELEHRAPDGRLLAVGVCDLSRRSLSSVYFYWDPDEKRRSLGVFGAMAEINLARELEIPHYYLGYWIKGSRTMEYKDRFRPNEILHPDGLWRPHRR